jgi:hypothetical protein
MQDQNEAMLFEMLLTAAIMAVPSMNSLTSWHVKTPSEDGAGFADAP